MENVSPRPQKPHLEPGQPKPHGLAGRAPQRPAPLQLPVSEYSLGPGGRYVGRSSRQGAAGRPITGPVPVSAAREVGNAASTPLDTSQLRIRVPALPWSGRLVIAVVLLSILSAGIRALSLFTPVADTPLGVQATYAAYSQVAVGGGLPAPGVGSGGLLEAPWVGYAPANPTSALPAHEWLAGLLMSRLGMGEWTGRLLSILFAVAAGFALFSCVRRAAGVLAAVYALLFYSVAPVSILLGARFSPDSLLILSQALAVLTLLNWHLASLEGRPSNRAFWGALAAASLAGALDPAAIFLAAPATYLIITEGNILSPAGQPLGPRAAYVRWNEAWAHSKQRGKVFAYAGVLAGSALAWWLYSAHSSGLLLGANDGGGGVGGTVSAVLTAGTYIAIIGNTIGKMLTVAGLLLLGGGVMHGARQGSRALFHVWLLAGLAHVLLDGARVGRHDDALLPLLLPACALVGIGASWAGSMPARVWLAMNEPRSEPDAEFAVSPHTAFLFDLPETRAAVSAMRPQARPALRKTVSARSQQNVDRVRRAGVTMAGHLAVLVALAVVASSGLQTAQAEAAPSVKATETAGYGGEIASLTDPSSRLIIMGPSAPEIFYTSHRTGWTLEESDFSVAQIELMQSSGAAYLVSTDQDWLGKSPEYVGLLAQYSVKKLSPGYIMFDLNTKPSDNDRLYFLESGHTLGGKFRTFWQANGGVAKLGYPISEEVNEAGPLDGQQRTVQYFERAVLEEHPEDAGTPDEVMRAAVGLWVTQGRDFPRVAAFQNTPERVYFPQTGHSVKEAFWRYWLNQGGLAAFGYPISEELPEISPADGKVYTVQYFERARFEWHPDFSGTPDEVQLGLIGKQALEMRK